MKKTVFLAFLAMLFTFLPPLLGLDLSASAADPSPLPTSPPPESSAAPELTAAAPAQERIRVLLSDGAAELDMQDYLLGVLAAEMPASFHMEALKAQAVACRTYTMYSIRHGGCKTNPSADVCTSSSCCQTYRSDAKLRRSWGNTYTYRYSVIAKAVMDTAGVVMLYNGKPINAMYHAASGGWTEDSENVYGSTFAYLRSVESPHEIGSRQTGEVRYHRGTFVEKVNGARPNAHMEEDKLEEQLKVLSLYTSGRVEKLQLNEDVITGRTARKLFGLDSAMFTVEITGDEVIFHTKGFGHGVGMSQAGANGMASDGADYKTILSHYYTGVSFGVIGQY